MRWENERRSDNVEDRRGMTRSKGVMGGGLGVLVIVLLAWFFGVDPTQLLNQMPESGSMTTDIPSQPRPADENRMAELVSVVLAETEDTWSDIFRRSGSAYQVPKLVLFTDAVSSACGFTDAAVGPFYCPEDQKVYIDLVFFQELKDRFQAPGEFAQAYVIAHEVGHHVQNLLGLSEQMDNAQRRVRSEAESNAISVRMELQADCLAGIWANHTERARHILEAGDVESALRAASAIGDDRLQRQTRGYVTPDSFTHGSSEQRMRWFSRGFQSGDMAQCNTFKSPSL
jgi:uncharacterized protein